jgi:nicotinamidase-related amidase
MLTGMSDPFPTRLPRSIELMSRGDTGLLVVDMQEKLLKLIPGHERVIWNCRRLIDGAKVLGIPVAATEQYPQGLGPTTGELASRLPGIPAKLAFSCGECAPIFEQWQQQGIFKILVVGIEAHVCVQQTVMDLLGEAYRVFLAVDAIGARHAIDYDTAIRRMDSAGATITTTEAALFEWCEVAGTPEFKQISALVRESPPG